MQWAQAYLAIHRHPDLLSSAVKRIRKKFRSSWLHIELKTSLGDMKVLVEDTRPDTLNWAIHCQKHGCIPLGMAKSRPPFSAPSLRESCRPQESFNRGLRPPNGTSSVGFKVRYRSPHSKLSKVTDNGGTISSPTLALASFCK